MEIRYAEPSDLELISEYDDDVPEEVLESAIAMKQFAGNFPERLHDKLMANEMLRRFLDAANRRRAKKS